jgi:hypothetical protein
LFGLPSHRALFLPSNQGFELLHVLGYDRFNVRQNLRPLRMV